MIRALDPVFPEFPHSLENMFLSAVRRWGTPLYLYDKAHLLQQCKKIKKMTETLSGPNQQVAPFFAMKANSNPFLLKEIKKNGFGFDVVSGGEMRMALRARAKPQQIIFSGIGKTTDELDFAISRGIRSIQVESIEELGKLAVRAKIQRKTIEFSIRYNPDVSVKTHPNISTGLRENKFGLDHAALLEVLRRWKEFSDWRKYLKWTGLSVHIGSQLHDGNAFREAFVKLKEVFLLVSRELESLDEPRLSRVDLGGGLGIQYLDETPLSEEQYGQIVEEVWKDVPVSEILMEPGRRIIGSCGYLMCEVLYVKRAISKDSKNFVIVDAGMNDLMRPALYGARHPVYWMRQEEESDEVLDAPFVGDLVGPVCESTDVFRKNMIFPSEIAAGDWIIFGGVGAYGWSMSNFYNARPLPPEVLVTKTKQHLIRKRFNPFKF